MVMDELDSTALAARFEFARGVCKGFIVARVAMGARVS